MRHFRVPIRVQPDFTEVVELLETVLFAKIRFHDTVSRGRLLNRFGKDFESESKIAATDVFNCRLVSLELAIDSVLADHFGRTIVFGLNVLTTVLTITYVGGPLLLLALILLGVLYYNAAKVYGQTSRDMRRLGLSSLLGSYCASLHLDNRFCNTVATLFYVRREYQWRNSTDFSVDHCFH